MVSIVMLSLGNKIWGKLVQDQTKGTIRRNINTLPQFDLIRQIATASVNQIRQVLFLPLSVVSLDAEAFMSFKVWGPFFTLDRMPVSKSSGHIKLLSRKMAKSRFTNHLRALKTLNSLLMALCTCPSCLWGFSAQPFNGLMLIR